MGMDAYAYVSKRLRYQGSHESPYLPWNRRSSLTFRAYSSKVGG